MSAPEPFPAYTSAAIDAVTEAARTEHDMGGWLSLVLTYAAARLGSLGALTAGRPGSWEAAHVDHLARGLAFDDAGLAWYAADDRARREVVAPPARFPGAMCKRCRRITPSIPCPRCDGPACAGCGRCPPCDGDLREDGGDG